MSDDGRSRTDSTVITVSVLRVIGEVDSATAPDLRGHLSAATADPSVVLVVDLSDVTFMSCSGLLPLLEAQARVGDRLWLRDLSRPVRRLLDVTRLQPMFSVLDGTADSDQRDSQRFASPRAGRSHPRTAGFAVPTTMAASRSPRDDGSDVVRTTAVFELQAQITGLQDQMRRDVLIEQAKGLLMGIHRCDAATSWRLLAAASQEHDVSVDDLARALATAAAGRADCASSHVALAAVRALMSPAQQRGA